MSNTFGRIFRLTSFGESHGESIGGVVDGCPAGFALSLEKVQHELDSRYTVGKLTCSSGRKEPDKVHFLSGLFEGKTTGAPLAFIIKNEDVHSADYNALKNVYRPSHADYTWHKKYGLRDHRGGGRTSARELVVRIVGGAIAKQLLAREGIQIKARVTRIGEFSLPQDEDKVLDLLETLRTEGDSVGGEVGCEIYNVPVGLGEPVYDKLSARLAYAMMSINAAKGFEYGSGFTSVLNKGSELNDEMYSDENGEIHFYTNNSGGIQGGISNGETIYFRVAFKPIPTIAKPQKTVDTDGNMLNLEAGGRHDVCAAVKAVSVVEAMAAMTLLDFILLR
ncbi:MAG: chorismate synthase [Culturomica sp.]|jgi:chorismate synthase|nr:chorismate synthase [Culturomica sp.]